MTEEQSIAALDALPEKFRAAFLRAGVQKFSCKKVAEILQIPTGTFMLRRTRSGIVLRESLPGATREYGIVKATAKITRSSTVITLSLYSA